MVENRPLLTLLAHLTLILGVAVVALPIWIVLVTSSQRLEDVIQAPIPMWFGDQIVRNYADVLTAGVQGSFSGAVAPMLLNSTIMAVGIAVAATAVIVGLPRSDAGDHGALWPVFTGAGLLLAIGALDDARPLPWWLKLAAQAGAAALAVRGADLGIDALGSMPLLADALAIAWVVLIANAWNLIDHADGMCAVTGIISAAVLLAGARLAGDAQLAALWLALIGGLAGFLCWNLPPARLYLGDAGSLPLGFLIACGTLATTFWPSERALSSPLALAAPLLICAVPLFDTAAVVVKRLRRGVAPWRGDRNHLGHRLARRGLGPRAGLAATAALQAALAASALQLCTGDQRAAWLAAAQAVAVLVALTLIETARDG